MPLIPPKNGVHSESRRFSRFLSSVWRRFELCWRLENGKSLGKTMNSMSRGGWRLREVEEFEVGRFPTDLWLKSRQLLHHWSISTKIEKVSCQSMSPSLTKVFSRIFHLRRWKPVWLWVSNHPWWNIPPWSPSKAFTWLKLWLKKELRTVSSSEKFQKAHGMSWDWYTSVRNCMKL